MDDQDMPEGEDNMAAIIEATAFDELIGKSVEEILRDGQKTLFARLVAKVRANAANHQELAILRNILKDNGFVLVAPEQAVKNRAQPPVNLPDFEERPEYDQ